MKTRLYVKALTLLALGSTLMAGGCMPENFWVNKWGEIVNRGIFGVINFAIGQGGAI